MSYQLEELARIVGGEVAGDAERVVESVCTLETAGPDDLSFVTSPKYRRQAAESAAGALLAAKPLEGVEKDYLLVDEPYYALALLLSHIYPATRPEPGVHPTAVVEQGAEVDARASVGPFAVIGEGSQLAAGVEIHSHAVVGSNSVVGADSVLYPRVVLYPGTFVGQRCILHAGVVVGSDGFGYALHDDTHVKLQHAGRVVVEDEVEIGANSTLDRALLGETRVGAGSKIDNLVQVAHNVRLGDRCLLVSQSGIAGSTRLGRGVVLAGQAGVAGHLELGDGVQVAAKSAVFKSVEAGRTVAGIPAVNMGAWRRQQALVNRLNELKQRLQDLEAKASASHGEDDIDV